jgi:hypothetical protein
MQNLDLSAEGEAAAPVSLLTRIIADDRYPLLPRVHTLKAILSKLRPEPARQPLPPPKVYPPSKASAAAVGAPRKDRRHRDRREGARVEERDS